MKTSSCHRYLSKFSQKSGSFRGISRTEKRNSPYDSVDETSIGATTKRMINLSGYICVKKDKYNPNYKSLVAIEPSRSIREVQETSKFKEINLLKTDPKNTSLYQGQTILHEIFQREATCWYCLTGIHDCKKK